MCRVRGDIQMQLGGYRPATLSAFVRNAPFRYACRPMLCQVDKRYVQPAAKMAAFKVIKRPPS